MSSFEVVEHLLNELRSDRTPFPNVERLVVVGHSAGGQFVNRFAAAVKLRANEHAVVMNPRTYLYVDGRRRMADGTFSIPEPAPPDYDYYRYGLQNLNGTLCRLKLGTIRNNLLHNQVHYLAGTLDVEDEELDVSEAAMLQGRHR